MAAEEGVLVEVLVAAAAAVALVADLVAPLGGGVAAPAEELALGEGAGVVEAVPLDQDTQHPQTIFQLRTPSDEKLHWWVWKVGVSKCWP